MPERRRLQYLLAQRLLGFVLSAAAVAAHAGVGMVELAANAVSGPVTVFYPTRAAPAVVDRGPFQLEVAVDAAPFLAGSHLVVISHGSPGMPWTHFELAKSRGSRLHRGLARAPRRQRKGPE